MELPESPDRALGPFRSPGGAAEIRPVELSVAVVVRCRKGRADRQTVLRDFTRMAQLSRRHLLALGAGALSAASFKPAAADAGKAAFGLSGCGERKNPGDFHHFDYVNADAPKGGMFSQLVGAGG